jgi:hypothetical protein
MQSILTLHFHSAHCDKIRRVLKMEKKIDSTEKINKELGPHDSCFCTFVRRVEEGAEIENIVYVRDEVSAMTLHKSLRAGAVAILKSLCGKNIDDTFLDEFKRPIDKNLDDIIDGTDETEMIKLISVLDKVKIEKKSVLDKVKIEKKVEGFK